MRFALPFATVRCQRRGNRDIAGGETALDGGCLTEGAQLHLSFKRRESDEN